MWFSKINRRFSYRYDIQQVIKEEEKSIGMTWSHVTNQPQSKTIKTWSPSIQRFWDNHLSLSILILQKYPFYYHGLYIFQAHDTSAHIQKEDYLEEKQNGVSRRTATSSRRLHGLASTPQRRHRCKIQTHWPYHPTNPTR